MKAKNFRRLSLIAAVALACLLTASIPRAKLEWYRELTPARPARWGASQPLSLKVSANPKHMVAPRRAVQIIYVFVTDQKDLPLAGAPAALVAHDGSGHMLRATLPATDRQGFTAYSFNVGQFNPGQSVIVEVTAGFQDLSTKTQTSFFPWF